MADTRSRFLIVSSDPFERSTSRSCETTTPQSLKWLALSVTRSLASFSTSFSAARFSTLSFRPSQSSCRLHSPIVWGFSRRRRAISELLVISPMRNSRRASSRTLPGAFGIGSCLQEVPGQIRQAPGLPVPARSAVARQLHRLVDELLLLRGHHEAHDPGENLLGFLGLGLQERGDLLGREFQERVELLDLLVRFG